MSNEEIIEGRQIDDTIYFDRKDIKDKDISIPSSTYMLSRWEFERLKRDPRGYKKWATNLLYMFVGGILLVVSKVSVFLWRFSRTESPGKLADLNVGVSAYEIVYIVVLGLVSGAVYYKSQSRDSERDEIIRDISKRFD